MSRTSRVKLAVARCVHRVSLRRRIPLLAWLPTYTAGQLARDALAGLTVALMAVPQGIAYGQLAGLPPHFGLYACLLTGICYAVLGTTDVVSIGPTAVMSLLTAEFAGGHLQRSVFLAFFTGTVILVAGCFRLGFLVDFFSVPVVSGFVSAASITICSTQIKGLLGIKGSSGKTMTATLRHIFLHIRETKLWDLFLGVVCIAVLLCLRKLGEVRRRDGGQMKPARRHSALLTSSLWLLSIARNAVVVLLASVLVLVLEHHHLHPFSTTETVAVGFPSPQLPPFLALAGNGTAPAQNGSWVGVLELAGQLGIGLLVVPLVSVIECMAIAKAFAAHGRPQDHSQEMVALGVCNLIGSLFSSYTVTGSFSRTALNHASGAATPIAGVITCLFVVVALGSLTPYFRYIPTATLSAVIICAVVFMVDWRIVLDLWRCRKLDLLPLLVTFLVGLFWRLEYGILLGTGVSLLLLLYRAARPKVTLTFRLTPAGHHRYLLVLPDCGLNYPAAEHVRELILEAARTNVAPSDQEMEAKSIVKAAPPPVAQSLELNAASAAETAGDVSKRVDDPRSNYQAGYDLAFSGITEEDEETIPFADDVNIDDGSPQRSNGYHPASPSQRNHYPSKVNGSCGDTCCLDVVLETDAVAGLRHHSNGVRNRRSSVLQESAGRGEEAPLPVVLNCRNIRYTDFTAAKSLAAAARSLQRQGGGPLLLLEVKPSVLAVWSGADPGAFAISQSEAAAAQLIDTWGGLPPSDDQGCVEADIKHQQTPAGDGTDGSSAAGPILNGSPLTE